jgi:hypothetical protein
VGVQCLPALGLSPGSDVYAADLLCALPGPIRCGQQLAVLLSADSAALGLWADGHLELHKVLTGYTIRRKAGKAQLTHLRRCMQRSCCARTPLDTRRTCNSRAERVPAGGAARDQWEAPCGRGRVRGSSMRQPASCVSGRSTSCPATRRALPCLAGMRAPHARAVLIGSCAQGRSSPRARSGSGTSCTRRTRRWAPSCRARTTAGSAWP